MYRLILKHYLLMAPQLFVLEITLPRAVILSKVTIVLIYLALKHKSTLNSLKAEFCNILYIVCLYNFGLQ